MRDFALHSFFGPGIEIRASQHDPSMTEGRLGDRPPPRPRRSCSHCATDALRGDPSVAPSAFPPKRAVRAGGRVDLSQPSVGARSERLLGLCGATGGLDAVSQCPPRACTSLETPLMPWKSIAISTHVYYFGNILCKDRSVYYRCLHVT